MLISVSRRSSSANVSLHPMGRFLLSAVFTSIFLILHRFCDEFCKHYGTGQFAYHQISRWTSTSVFQRHCLHFSILIPCQCHFRVHSLTYRMTRVTNRSCIYLYRFLLLLTAYVF